MTYLKCLHHLSYIILLLCLCSSYHGAAGETFHHTSFLAVPGPISPKLQKSYDFHVLLHKFSPLTSFLMYMRENVDKFYLKMLSGMGPAEPYNQKCMTRNVTKN